MISIHANTFYMPTLYAVSKTTALAVRREILGCEACSKEPELPLCWLLDAVTGREPARTDYVLPEPIPCPECGSPITEETLVAWD